MAITWNVKITVLDVSRKEATIVATRTDSEDADNPEVITIASALLNTPAQKTAELDNIWEHHLSLAAKNAAIAAIVSDLQIAAKANLEAREV